MFGFSAAPLLEGYGGVEMTSVATNSSMTVPLTHKDQAVLGGQVASRRGIVSETYIPSPPITYYTIPN